MFIRTERSVKEFIQFYPLVSGIVIIHIILWFVIDFLQLSIGDAIYNWGAGFNPAITNGEYWRLVTAIFLHGGLMHALFNSFSLVLFGPALEQMLGKLKFLFAYLGAGIIGNLATYFIEPNAFYVHIGASGAIYGLFGVYIYMVFFRKELIDQGSAQIIKVIFIIGLIMTFVSRGVNIYAHIFGFIGGFALAPLVLTNVHPYSPWRNRRKIDHDDSVQFDPNRWRKKQKNKKMFAKGLWIFLGILVVLGLLGRIM